MALFLPVFFGSGVRCTGDTVDGRQTAKPIKSITGRKRSEWLRRMGGEDGDGTAGSARHDCVAVWWFLLIPRVYQYSG